MSGAALHCGAVWMWPLPERCTWRRAAGLRRLQKASAYTDIQAALACTTGAQAVSLLERARRAGSMPCSQDMAPAGGDGRR